MNKDLKNRIFDIPQNILNLINHTLNGLNGEYFEGVNRAKKLLADKKVKYGQLKRIIHDINNVDKNSLTYKLYGGQPMETWAKQFLQGERDLIVANKKSKQRSNNLGGGDKNPFLKKHSKKQSWLPPTNLIKSNSHKSSVSSLSSLKLFEEIEKIKKLMS